MGDKIPPVGTLYLVGTPISNLENMSLRLVRILRVTQLLLDIPTSNLPNPDRTERIRIAIK
jgi:hypothetical protein